MEFEKLKIYQELLLKQQIQKNEESIKKWTQERDKHKNVIQGLQTIANELSVSCMVPLGKRALMKGKLYHTNEILACIGDGYFVKYSTEQVIALCNRRIERFEEVLKKLEQERNLYESRQILPLHYGAFASDDCKDVIEYWNDDELTEWKVKHREREKEYRQKLSKLKNVERKEIETEEDLFQRLDDLELEEELADEYNRLEDEHQTLYGSDLHDSEVSDETDEEKIKSDDEKESKTFYDKQIENQEECALSTVNTAANYEANNSTTQINQPNQTNLQKLENLVEQTNSSQKIIEKVKTYTTQDTKINGKFEVSIIKEDEIEKVLEKPNVSLNSNITAYKSALSNEQISRSACVSFKDSSFTESDIHCEKLKNSERRVSFAEPHFVEIDYHHNENLKQNSIFDQMINPTNFGITSEDDDIIKIDFQHSETQSLVDGSSNNYIMSPGDIYRIYCKPKSILKRSLDSYSEKSVRILESSFKEDVAEEDNDNNDNENVTKSTYNIVVQDVQERKKGKTVTDNKESIHTKRPISRFRLERTNIKK